MIVAHAISAGEFGNRILEHIVEPLVALMAFIALLLFVITAVRFVHNADSSKDRGSWFRSLAIIILGIFVIFSVYTIFVFVGRLANSDIPLTKEPVQFGPYDLVERKTVPTRNLQLNGG